MAVPAVLFAAAALAAGGPATAHITLETAAACAGSYYKAVFRVSHGCSGASTTAIRVRIPDGAASVKPQPKPGWQLAIVTAEPKDGGHAGHGHGGHGGSVAEIAWTGGTLANEHYDEFVIRLKLPDAPGTVLHFPVVQTCTEGELRWVEILDPAKPASHDRRPAPSLRLEARP
jgi:uncharacterized protein YcnI